MRVRRLAQCLSTSGNRFCSILFPVYLLPCAVAVLGYFLFFGDHRIGRRGELWMDWTFRYVLFLLFALGTATAAMRDISRRRMADGSSSSNSTNCTVDFSYVRNFSSTVDLCGTAGNGSVCCSALLNTLGIGLAEYLREAGGFEFPDLATESACLSSYQAALDETEAKPNFQDTCFPIPYSAGTFVQEPVCAGIMNISDWNRVVGPHALDRSCSGDLTDPLKCQVCTDDVTKAVLQLQALSNDTHDQQCVYNACLYAAGVANKMGPRNPSTAVCLLGLTLPYSDSRISKHKKVGLYVGVGVGGTLAVILLLIAAVYAFQRRQKQKQDALIERTHEPETRMPNLGLIKFSYDELKSATQNFSQKNFIGEGGYGIVYRGVLAKRGNMEVAVKVMKNSSLESNAEFLNEVEVINRVRHRNLVHVRGACVYGNGPEGHQHILVYDYLPNGCLHDYLSSGSKMVLSWPQRRKIAVDMAVGINYLHNEVQPAIIHRDIKPSNILLDEGFNACVADFGLAKLTPEGMSHLTTRVAGTPVYMAVEYALYGQCSEKVDVYSFGIVLLELMTGRKALDTTGENPAHYHIVDWAWSFAKAGRVEEIIDVKVRDNGPVSVMKRFVLVGILCAHLLVAFRPPMSQALKMLEGDEEIPPIPDRPAAYAWTSPESPHSLPYTEAIADASELLR